MKMQITHLKLKTKPNHLTADAITLDEALESWHHFNTIIANQHVRSLSQGTPARSIPFKVERNKHPTVSH